jgi:hypothetical protein
MAAIHNVLTLTPQTAAVARPQVKDASITAAIARLSIERRAA